ncbi:MAG: transporter [Sulfuricurvum sp.]|nr:transporter [Sulfuricurvum sp.]
MKNRVLFLLTIPAIASFASEDPIVADRPGFATGTHTVKPNVVHAEVGYQYAFNNHYPEQSTHTLPLMVLRTGLSEKGEIDVLWDGFNIDREKEQPTVTSKADLSIGGKYKLYESAQYNLTALGILSLPTGTSPSTSDSVDPLVAILWDYSVSDNNTVFGTVQASSSQLDHNRMYDTQFAIGTSISHTQSLGSFLEFYTVMPSEPTLYDTRVIDGGMTYLLTNDIQLDFSVGIGLTRYSSNFVNFGIASRF